MVNIKGIFDALSKPVANDISIKITPDAALELKIGQILSGEVVKTIDSNNALVRFGEFEILANTAKTLIAGEPLVVKVESLSPQIVMRLLESDILAEDKLLSLLKKLPIQKIDIGRSIEDIGRIIANLSDQEDAPEIITRFKEVLSSIPLKPEERLTPKDVKRTIHDLGGFYENKIFKMAEGREITKESAKELRGDIKGQLLMLLEEMESAKEIVKDKVNPHTLTTEHSQQGVGVNPKIAKELEAGLKNLLSSIESHQAANSLSQKHDNSFMLQIPYLAQGGFKTLKLYIKDKGEGKEKGRQKEEYNLVFILDMANTGMLRIDVSVNDKNVHCRLNVENENVALFFRQFLPDLVKGLSNGDINATAECTIARKEFIMEEPVREFLKAGSFRLVDVKA